MGGTDTESISLPNDGSLTIEKTGVLNDGGDGVDASDTISYSYKVTNTSNVTLENIAVTDSFVLPGTNGQLSAIVCPSGVNPPGLNIISIPI